MKIELRRYWAVLLALALVMGSLPVRADVKPPPGATVTLGNVTLPAARNSTGLHLLSFVSPYDYGAKCDGSTDDYTALAAWLAAGSGTVGLLVPNATCIFKTPLVRANGSNLAIYGGGPYQSVLKYAGTATTGDLISIGATGPQSLDMYFANFRIASSTVMTANAALHIKNAGRVFFNNVTIDGADGNQRLWNGVWFDQVDNVHYDGYDIFTQNDGVIVNGTVGVGAKAGLFLSHGRILQAAGAGIHVAGGFGGLYLDSSDIINNNVNLLIDTSIAAEGNREILIGDTTSLDSATTDNVQINDTLTSSATLNLCGWVASAHRYNVNVISWPSSRISVCGGPIFNATSDGIHIADLTATINVSNGTQIHSNGGYGINATGSMTVQVTPGSLKNNTSGATNNVAQFGSLSASIPVASGWAFDGTTITATIANGANQALTVGSGKILVANNTNGDLGEYNCGNGVCSLINSLSATFVASTTTPAAGKASMAYSGSAYAIYNNTGGSVLFYVTTVRVRPAN